MRSRRYVGSSALNTAMPAELDNRHLEAWTVGFDRDVVSPVLARLEAEVPSTLYHYTTVAGLVGLFQSDVLWLTHARCLNDASEWDYALDVYRGALSSPVLARTLTENHPLAKGLQGFDSFLGANVTPYVACFCESGDLLSQWRGYGRGGGYALGFDATRLVSANGAEDVGTTAMVRLRKVMYDKPLQLGLVSELLTKAIEAVDKTPLQSPGLEAAHRHALARVATTLTELLLAFKRQEFEEEQEWRLIALDLSWLPSGGRPDASDRPELRFRHDGRHVIPYFEYDGFEVPAEKPRLPLRELVIGPGVEASIARYGVDTLIADTGRALSVTQSRIPLRPW